MAQDKNLNLSAVYSSPASEPFTITHSLPAPASASVSDKSQYLSSLRQAVAATQDQVNKELTSRMEEDNSRAANGAKGVDEAREEENYGEEVQEEED
ncbi:hypothetical protein ACO1O0_007434 [Amphichorda felina]